MLFCVKTLNTDAAAAQRLLARCVQASFGAELSASIKTMLWLKLAFICAQAALIAAVPLPIGDPHRRRRLRRSAAWLR